MTPSFSVRDLDPASPTDAEGVTAVLRAAVPPLLTTPEAIRWSVTRAPGAQRFRLLLAQDEEGLVLGRAQVGLAHESPTPGAAFCNVYVHPEHVRRGVGSALVREAEKHLAEVGGRSVYSWVLEGPGNRAFAASFGYTPSRSAHFLRLDLTAGLPEVGEVPDNVALLPAAAFAGDPRPLFLLDAECTGDEPSDVGAELDDYADWLEHTWNHPLFDRDLTTVAVVDGVPAAFSAAHCDRVSRYSSAMTGTLRAYRGRGLARLAKTTALHRARAAGLTEAFTGNDTENGPMLAINRRLGYEIAATEVRHVHALG
ncbi:GNAT family N-acetyltransferase [Streptomyces sp. NPDC049954]|uniref:GNAT family N-acetyltransferase n=1 Tax=Streptomyces sp. NPDC049954 TaxID=3155779 RepID=UPI003435F32B